MLVGFYFGATWFIHVVGGKGRKDREIMLSPEPMDAVRQYCRSLKRKPRTGLFPGGRCHNHADEPMTDKVVWYACNQARNVRASATHRVAISNHGGGCVLGLCRLSDATRAGSGSRETRSNGCVQIHVAAHAERSVAGTLPSAIAPHVF